MPGYRPTDPPQQGPWSANPTTLPWISWDRVSGPRPPWWQTWQAGLAQGLPLWELLVLGAALIVFAVGIVSISIGVALHPAARPLGLLIPVAIAVVWFLEQRMRERLARR